MNQTAVIKDVLDNGYVNALIERKSACGHDCSSCHGCGGMENQMIVIQAKKNGVDCVKGDTVILETGTQKVLGAALIVYIIPLIALLVLYGVGTSLGLSYVASCVLGVIGFALAIIGAVIYSKYVKKHESIVFVVKSKA